MSKEKIVFRKQFSFFNSNIRIDSPAETHRTEKVLWLDNSEEAWALGDWNRFKDIIKYSGFSRGTKADADFISIVLNTLAKYVSKNTQYTGFTESDKVFFQLDDVMAEELFNQLKSINLGSSGTALSLVNYVVSGKGVQTAQNAGFSFESRFSELVQRLAGKQDFDVHEEKKKIILRKPELITKGKKKGQLRTVRTEIKVFDERKNLRTGSEMVDVGQYILSDAIDITENFENAVVNKIDEGVKKQNQESQQIGKIGYKVPNKADISVPVNMTIYTEYSPIITKFLKLVEGKSFSLKNTSKPIIKIGSTNDDERLAGFASYFFNKKLNIAGIATFVFASRRAGEQKGNEKVLKYTNWARVFYELMGAGQFDKQGNELFVDYIVINSYNPDGSSGHVNVFTVDDLLQGAPEKNPTPPFMFSAEKGRPYGGPIELNLTKLPSGFIFAK